MVSDEKLKDWMWKLAEVETDLELDETDKNTIDTVEDLKQEICEELDNN